MVYIDHKNLEYFMNARVLNCRQARWNMSLSRFDFIITYCPGNLQGKLDALSQRSYMAPKPGDEVLSQQTSVIFKPSNLQLKALAISSIEDVSYMKDIREALKDDPFVISIKRRIQNKENVVDFEFKDDLLYYRGLLYVPPGSN